MPYFTEKFGNASSLDHPFGYDASVAVEAAREKIANAIGARHDEIVFTSGATESDNLALIGTMQKYKEKGDHLITCVTEHKAVLDTARHLESLGKKVTYLPVNEYGEINLEELKNSITDKTVMISIMAANNEIGTIADVAEIGKIAHENDVIFHTDAAQAVGHIPMNVEQMKMLQEAFEQHAEAFAHYARAADCLGYQSDWRIGAQPSKSLELNLKNSSETRSVLRHCSARAGLLMAEGKFDGALKLGLQMLSLSRRAEHEPMVIGYLVGTACRLISLNVIGAVLERSPLTDEQRQQIDSALAECESVDGFQHALVSERIYGLA